MTRYLNWLTPIIVLAIIIGLGAKNRVSSEFDLDGFGQLPVVEYGRIKPLDTVARNALVQMTGRQSITINDTKLHPIEWLIDVVARPSVTDNAPSFRIQNTELREFLGLSNAKPHRYSFTQLLSHSDKIWEQADQAQQLDAAQRSAFQRAIIVLKNNLSTYFQLKNTFQLEHSRDFANHIAHFNSIKSIGKEALLRPKQLSTSDRSRLRDLFVWMQSFTFMDQSAQLLAVPPTPPNTTWISVGKALLNSIKTEQLSPAVTDYATLITSYRSDTPETFNTTLASYTQYLQTTHPKVLSKSRGEAVFNHYQPFYSSLLLYGLLFVWILAIWLFHRSSQLTYVYSATATIFGVHTLGLLARIWIQGRPPVTNLYSSAVFVGWVIVGVCLWLEKRHRSGIPLATATLTGFITLIIAHNLALSGDTLEQMRAVLDTNFWLATHVITVTIGYAGAILAGVLATFHVFKTLLSKSTPDTKQLDAMIFGSLCFCLLFAFVGTVLGGIWADQSWGRFWGWDPKENGALMIVLWTAIILHARLGGLIRTQGLVMMTIFNNIVVAFSWFGVNMLGIGLHAYGFTDATFKWLIIFCASQAAIMLLPLVKKTQTKTKTSQSG